MNKKPKYRKPRNPLHLIAKKVFNILFRCRKITQNKVFFINFSNKYDCNPKYICEELLNEKVDCQIVFATSKKEIDNADFPNNITVVYKSSPKFFKEIYSSKIIIDNDVTLPFMGFKKKKGQVVFETWHGSIGIKAFGREANDDKLWHKMADRSSKMIDFMVSNSKFENEIYKNTFWKNNEVLLFGHPRNDIFFFIGKKLSQLKEKFYEQYGISKTAKLCLYAPTFRDNQKDEPFKMDFAKLRESLSLKFGGEWTILFRFHAVSREKGQVFSNENGVIDVSDYPDIQEITSLIDCGITDYSSWICEYLLRKKPGFIFAVDAEQYQNNDRKLAIPLEKLPFPVSYSMDDLLKNISLFDTIKYEEKCTQFLKQHGSADDGHASRRVVERIKKFINEGCPNE